MVIPEKEARSKRCPLLNIADGSSQLCLGADCMMWRFKHPEKRTTDSLGYCGIAGKPVGAF